MKLRGKSLKGKNSIREHGEFWTLEFEADTVIFDSRPGPWALVSPCRSDDPDGHSRWIHLKEDRDFTVISN